MRCSILALSILTASSLAACSHRSASESSAAAADPTRGLPSAEFALGYKPGQGAGELEIQRAQQALRSAPGQAGDYARLAQAFLQRERETADSTLAAYAEDAIIAAEARDPRDPDVRIASILRQHSQHRFAEARDAARALIAAAPERSIGFLLLGDALLELGDYGPATDAYQQAIDLLPDLRSYSRGAYIRWLHGDVDGALQLMEAALEAAGPDAREPSAWVYVEIGDMLRRRGKYRAAGNAAERALALVPGYLPARALRARVHGHLDQRDDAIAELGQVVARRPTAELLLALADLLDQAGRMPEAAARVAEAEKLASHDPMPLALYLARHRESPDRALALAAQAVGQRPSIFAIDAQALALARLGRVAEAREAMTRALRLDTPSADLHLHRAVVELAAGDRRAAGAELARARAIEPDADPVLVAELERDLATAHARR
ncbi:MAG TPA: tetratricopeptide repeat protein [Kofleriaceae bacterium]|nr:tetratricopeptide repeat protein [Kofleriaceae bacterium]